MLPAAHRLRSAGDFRRTMRGGLRAGRPGLVVTGSYRSDGSDPSVDPDPAVRVGLIVSKAVGGAVTRNRVKRRLRHAVATQLSQTPARTDWVVRALPASADAPDLADQLTGAWQQVNRKLTVRDSDQGRRSGDADRSGSGPDLDQHGRTTSASVVDRRLPS